MFLTTKTIFLFWLLIQPSSGSFLRPKTIVTVRNNLEGGPDLFLHCKSAENDLGVQDLHPNCSFSWTFQINFFRTTLFHCSFQWEYVLHKFDIYEARRDADTCDTCSWEVKKDGPCMLFSDKSICYHWDVKEKE